MRRLAVVALLAATVLAVVALPRAEGDGTYRVDAIFDTAKGVIPGQLVKIAGARVGTIEDVTLTGDYKARIHLEVDRRFAPFRSDATCSIQPEGLLAENFVQCDPGTPRGRVLRGTADHAPTLPVTRTSTPVNLNDLFDVWSVPTRDRLRILLNELGISVAGRGEDLNALLRRANPALAQARRTLAIVTRQRAQLARAVADTDRVVGELAGRRDRVQAFVSSAARLGTRTARRRRELGESIRRLPGLLRAARPALVELDALAASGTPLLRELRVAAPQVNRLVLGLEPFARAGLPALRGIEPALRTTRRAVRASRPLMREIRRFTAAGKPLAPLVSRLFVDARDRGFIEHTLQFLYYAAAAGARFDRHSHIIPAHVILNPCARYSQEPVAGCDARYSRPAAAAARERAARRPRRGRGRTAPPPPAPVSRVAPPARPGAPAAPAPRPGIEGLVDDVVRQIVRPTQDERTLEELAGWLLR